MEHTSGDILRVMQNEAIDGLVTMRDVKKHFRLKTTKDRERFNVQVAFLISSDKYIPTGDGKRGYVGRQPFTDWPHVETDMNDWRNWAKEGK